MNKILHSSASMEWATPPEVFKALDDEFHFTLDPCCTDENAKCRTHYTAVVNGLKQPWAPHRVFMNPPYGRQVGKWIKKAYQESQAGALVVCLIYAKTDTSWWHDYVLPYGEIRFIRGRIHFLGWIRDPGQSKDLPDDQAKYHFGPGPATHPSCIVIFKPKGT